MEKLLLTRNGAVTALQDSETVSPLHPIKRVCKKELRWPWCCPAGAVVCQHRVQLRRHGAALKSCVLELFAPSKSVSPDSRRELCETQCAGAHWIIQQAL